MRVGASESVLYTEGCMLYVFPRVLRARLSESLQ